ncbi:ion transporter [Agarivorans sp. MS3-6]|uniref:ion transporter n=1 Tax=Agarivorans sp. TSD2052 TaxID=2937286 RepID=UPI00200D0199|nr:ion transporter [Agarivorans sp. TSD2052]UPW17628.1 ion transporter [Agarivorans sp. TSD2052]
MSSEKPTQSPMQKKLYEIIFGYNSSAGKRFDLMLIVAILTSVLVVILNSVGSLEQQYHFWFITIEVVFTVFFTLEYIARLYCSPSPKEYAKSFYGVVDLLAILPTYLALIYPPAQVMLLFRLLRILRILRVLKLVRYMSEANVLLRALMLARRKILVFLFCICLTTTIYGALMYAIEGPENGFTSIPKSIYWAIVTITTVGYGDISPVTPLGQALAALVMITGFSIITVPTGIVGAELANEMRREQQANRCLHCERAGHDHDADYCKHCGASLLEES